jgi:hypothetical protein
VVHQDAGYESFQLARLGHIAWPKSGLAAARGQPGGDVLRQAAKDDSRAFTHKGAHDACAYATRAASYQSNFFGEAHIGRQTDRTPIEPAASPP